MLLIVVLIRRTTLSFPRRGENVAKKKTLKSFGTLKVLKGILYDFQRNASKYYYILQNNSLYRYYYSYYSYY